MENNNDVKFEVLQMPPANTNSVLVSVGGMAVIFDAWGRADDWEQALNERGLKLSAIYTTHGHSDHISAAPDLVARFNVPWFLNAQDHNLIWWGNGLLEYFGIPQIATDCDMPRDLVPGRHTILPGVNMDVILTPGHSAGGVAFYFPDFQILLIGDTLFQDNVGNYTFPGGDLTALTESIGRIYDMNLPDETYVVHGHGTDTTIGMLRVRNPYFHSAHKCHGCGHCHHDDTENHTCE